MHVCTYLLCVLAYVLECLTIQKKACTPIPPWQHTSASIYTHVHISVYNTHNQYLWTWTVTHIYTVAGESYANTMGRGGTWDIHPPPLLYLCHPFKMYQGILSILFPRSFRRFTFMLNSLIIQFLVSHIASQVKSAVSVNSIGYSTEHTSVPQCIAKLLISSFIYSSD